MLFKLQVYEHAAQLVNEKVSILQNKLHELIESTRNETKSSAGDKYETSRAMLQIEQDNVRKQLKDAREQKAIFEKIDLKKVGETITKGSLVKTDKAWFFVSIALGRIFVEGVAIVALSPQSPLGSKLMQMKATESVTVNGTTYTIKKVE